MLELALVLALFGTPELPKLEAHNLGISTVFLQPEPTVSATHFAFAVSEAHEGGTDLNSDGDLSDEVLHLLDLRTGSIANLGIVLSPFGGPVQLHLTGKFLVYRSQVEPFGIYRRDLVSGKTELLSDKHLSIYVDEDGWVILRTGATSAPFPVYRPDGRLADTLRLGAPITHFKSGLAALVPWEGHYRDFNGDHDAEDEVHMFYDVRTGRLVNSGLASYHKQSDDYPSYPARVTDNWIGLVVSELAQGNADLTVDYRISMIPVEDPAVNEAPGLGWHLDETGEPVYDGWEHPTGMDSLMQRGLVILTLTRNSDESIAWQAGASRKMETEESTSTFKSHANKLAHKLGREIPKAN